MKFDIIVIMDYADDMDGMDFMDFMIIWRLWTQARRTNYDLLDCENMYTSLRTPSVCVYM